MFARKQQADCYDLRFSIEDTGSGIPEAQQSKIWDLFHQVNNSNVRENGGIGIGLTLSRRLVHLMGDSSTWRALREKARYFRSRYALKKVPHPTFVPELFQEVAACGRQPHQPACFDVQLAPVGI